MNSACAPRMAIIIGSRSGRARCSRQWRNHPMRRNHQRHHRTAPIRSSGSCTTRFGQSDRPAEQTGLSRSPAGDPPDGRRRNSIRPTVLPSTSTATSRSTTCSDRRRDNVLIALTRRLRRLLRPQDTLRRLGGDQFGLILMSERDRPRSPTSPMRSARRSWYRSTTEIGRSNLTAFDRPRLMARSGAERCWMLDDAELAMFRAKKAGGNRGRTRSVRLSNLRLRTAYNSKPTSNAPWSARKLPSYTSPSSAQRCRNRRLRSVMRWDHPKRGNISPTEFIPIAENFRPDKPAGSVSPSTRPRAILRVAGAEPATCHLHLDQPVERAASETTNSMTTCARFLARAAAIRRRSKWN